MHERLSIHQLCFAELGIPEYVRQCQALGARRIGFTGPALLAPDALADVRAVLRDSELAVESIAHVFHAGPLSSAPAQWREPRDSLLRLIDAAAAIGAHSIYMLSGGHGGLAWEDAADCFSAAIAPCVERAKATGVGQLDGLQRQMLDGRDRNPHLGRPSPQHRALCDTGGCGEPVEGEAAVSVLNQQRHCSVKHASVDGAVTRPPGAPVDGARRAA